ncbi:hypothetical protein PR202_ga02966 [Eleusine coracana subsp. coracana]|uniref:Ribosomal RNA-processing protein 12-like conserved domain-containing protein n=1 Tax=Eleusine coracana subsp. coracana TaxID=191504 RepID=A0AAV5BMU4_ELECO|nr:hypothetical protein PR202_ga02966 [Eleusine coracana subsp. coracana]
MADVDMGELLQTPRSTAGDDDFSSLEDGADLAAAILSRLGSSPREDHQHLCATAAAMAQAVRDQGVPATSVAYFAAAAAALAPLARAGAEGADRHVAGALLAFLSAAVPALPAAVVRARGREVADDVVRVLEFSSTPDSGVRAGVRCIAHFISAGERASWEAVEPLYAVILRLATDHRPKVVAKRTLSDLFFQISFCFLPLGMSFLAVIGEFSSDLLPEAVKNLADMQNLSDDDFPFRKQLNTCLGSAVAAMGPKNVLEILEIQSICDENEWILSILEKYTVGASLQFFLSDILGIVRAVEKSIPKLLKGDKLFSAKRAEGYVYSLWSLLSSCCNYPCDTSSNFRALQNVLCDALQNQPDLRGIVCSSIQVLIKQNKETLSVSSEEDILAEDEISKSERRAKERYTKELAEENLKAIRAFSPKFPRNTLFYILGVVEEGYWSITAVNAEPVDGSSMDTEADDNTNSMTRALLLEFAASLMPGLSPKSINVLFSYVKPAIKDSDSLIQKRAYKVLSMLLKDPEFIEKSLDVLLELMMSSMPCQFPSKRYRLECLYHLIIYILKDSSNVRKREIVSSFITEILFALKEANKKTRNRAYDLLIEIARACEDTGSDERKESLHQFFGMVAGGLYGQTPCAISAAVTGLARLTYEFSDLIGVAYKLLPQAFLLMQRNNREIVKVKSLIEILVNKCGLDAVKAVMPEEEHMKLLTNIRKVNERKMRKAGSSEDGDAMSMTSRATRQSRWNHTQMFSDFGSDDDESNGITRHTIASRTGSKASTRMSRKRQADKNLLEKFIDQSTGEPLDLLDQKTSVKKRKTSSSGWAYTGHEYTSKKAGGDLTKKDKMEPYAYWPLDHKLLNRRSDRKASARKGMASVMKVAKRFEGKSAAAALSTKRTGKMKHKKNK